MTRRARGKAAKSLKLIDACHEILAEIQPASVRAVCYRLFTMGLVPDMSKSSTNGVGKQLVHARETGVIPWEWVVDETRDLERVPAWDDPEEFARAVQRSYRRDRWAQQPRRLEIWSEKGTVRGTLSPVLDQYGVGFRVQHGYSSATIVNQVAEEACDSENPLLALYCGDHDPSGMHMSEVDLPKRLAKYGGFVEIQRVALIEEDLGDLPSFDAATKKKDPRYTWFVRKYGNKCWELDALSPTILRKRVETHICAHIDVPYWNRCAVIERAEKESLTKIMMDWKGLLSGAAP